MPMVFCASLPPWPEAVEAGRDELQPAEELVQPRRVPAPEDPGHRDHQEEAEEHADESGASTMKISVFVQPDQRIAPMPALATAAPA